MDTHAPEFPESIEWMNTKKQLSLSSLVKQNSVMVIALWSSSSIDAINLFRDLEELMDDIGHSLTIVGIHHGKFNQENKRQSVEYSLDRLNTVIPVGHDEAGKVKSEYGVTASPSLVLIDSSGNIIGTLSGETPLPKLRSGVEKVIDEQGDNHFSTDESDLIKRDRGTRNPYPRYVSYSESRDQLAISDPSHHRIILYKLRNNKKFVLGGECGDKSGDLTSAKFCYPHGLEFTDEGLYVCDLGNHRVKGIDLEEKIVYNLLGSGKQGYEHDYSGTADTGLMAPYDLVKIENSLWVTMTGSHQIWRYHILEEQLESFLGTGAKGFQDGPHTQVTMAQPTGVSARDQTLYFVDSYSSSLRKYDPEEDWVETLVGQGLVDFGDVDGESDDALMQYPLDVEASEDYLYVSDTYNHKIKRFNTDDGTIESWLGNGKSGHKAGETTEFFEPSSVAIGKNKVYVADTNNNRCVSVDSQSWNSKDMEIF